MMAKSKFLGAASAVAMSITFAVPATVVVSLSGITVAQAAVVGGIDVRGNRRVDAQTVRNNLSIQPGKNYTQGDIDEGVKRLFAMGVFSDVRINQVGNRLIVQVKEYEVVNQVVFKGNKKVKSPDLERIVSLKPREAFEPSKISADEATIREAYRSIGRNDVVVKARTIDLGQGRVNVVYEINEGQRTKITNIVFEGNQAFGDRRLRDVISTKRTGLVSWLTRGDTYTEDRLQADEEALRRFYYNRGYADFQIEAAEPIFDEAKNAYTITFRVNEGARYKIGDVQIQSTVDGISTETMQSVLNTRAGDTYSAKRIEDTVLAINDRVADSGYAFAKVEPLGDRNFENHTISLVYNIDQGPRAYVQRIEIRGNSKTRDYVIRREFDLTEGDAFNQTMVQRAKRRLEGLGFFQTVNVSTQPGSEADQVVLIVDVIEKPTGEFSVGGGYTTGGESPGASVEASISERNFLGRGQYVRLGVGAGEDSARNYTLSFTEPYFLGYRLAAGFDIFRTVYRMNDDYDVRQTGGAIRFGVPITERLTGSIAYNYVEEEYDLDHDFPSDWTQLEQDAWYYGQYSGAIIEASENSPWRRSSISYGLTYNSVDDMRNPHDGLFVRVTQEYAGLGGDAKFLKTTGKAMMYKTLSEQYDLVGLLSVSGGYIHETEKGGVRIFDAFKSSTDMIRGFRYNGIGPYQLSQNGDKYFLGGTTYMAATAELQFPMPIVPESLGMRGALFVDAATLYNSTYSPRNLAYESDVFNNGSAVRASAGVSLMWASPFGPLRFDYAWPIKKEEGDKVQNFNFGVSGKF